MKKYLSFILAMLLLLAFSTSAFASEPIGMIEEEPMDYPFTEPYEYPIVPGTDEWSELTSLAEKIEVCHVPQMALDNMTTEALLETVLNYPLLGNIFAYDTPQKGFEAIREYCNGLQEIWTRPDLEEILEQKISEESFEENYNIAQRKITFVLYENLQGYPLAVPASLSWTIREIRTPAGEWVEVYVNSTWQDHGFNNATEAAEYCEAFFDEGYPDAERLRGPNPAYNCHSYSFYSTGSSNVYWMDGDQARVYISDGSYDPVSPGRAGDIAWYGVDHSGIIREVSNGQVTIRSKWGFGGLYEHLSYDCPYEVEYGIDYYR